MCVTPRPHSHMQLVKFSVTKDGRPESKVDFVRILGNFENNIIFFSVDLTYTFILGYQTFPLFLLKFPTFHFKFMTSVVTCMVELLRFVPTLLQIPATHALRHLGYIPSAIAFKVAAIPRRVFTANTIYATNSRCYPVLSGGKKCLTASLSIGQTLVKILTIKTIFMFHLLFVRKKRLKKNF